MESAFPSDSTLIMTVTYGTGRLNQCTSPNDGVVYHATDIDIGINLSANWHASVLPNSLPNSNSYDFYSSILHEIGHAHRIAHSMPDNRVMYYSISAGDTLRTIIQDDFNAGLWIMSKSVLEEGANCPEEMIQVFPEECNPFNEVSESPDDFDEMNIYPNPTNDFVWFSYLQRPNDEVEVDILEITGQIVYSMVGTISQLSPISFLGKRLKSGVYILRFQREDCTFDKRIILMQ